MKTSGLFLILLSLLFSTSAQNQHYNYQYNTGGFVNPALFYELGKDLGNPVEFSLLVEDYSYIQHLKNQNVFIELSTKVRNLDNNGSGDSLYAKARQLLELFPGQIPGYYYVSKYYLDNGQDSKALEVLKNGVFEYGIDPKRLRNLSVLAEMPEFTDQVRDVYEKYHSDAFYINLPDSSLVTVIDSIKYYDQLYRRSSPGSNHPDWIRQVELDSLHALKYRELVLEKGWLRKYLGRDYQFLHVPVMHWAIHEQLFFLDYIIADCKTNNAPWIEAEAIIWKIAAHQGRLRKNEQDYHSMPLLYFDSLSGMPDLKRSMLSIKSFAAGLSCTRFDEPIWLIATSEHPRGNYRETLELLKKYFIIFGFNEERVFIRDEILNKGIEDKLILRAAVVVIR